MARTGKKIAVQPYVFFEGRCDEAIEFYRKALGAEVKMLMRFKESPDPAACAANAGDKIMHAELRIGGTSLLVSDGQCQGKGNFQGFALTLIVPTTAEANQLFGALAKGGQVQMPLAKTFFSPRFGMLADRFGVQWMVYVAK